MGSTAQILVLGFIFHVIFIRSVFDCYFTSPVVHGMESFQVNSQEARRLVLIDGDGLRADLSFSKNGFLAFPGAPTVVAPHIHSITETRGAFGISHTRVPTESRPGHVAIIRMDDNSVKFSISQAIPTQLPPFALFLNALMLTDGMTPSFFFNVTDIGSWSEIGQTISFIVTSLMSLFSEGICAIGEDMSSRIAHGPPKFT